MSKLSLVIEQLKGWVSFRSTERNFYGHDIAAREVVPLVTQPMIDYLRNKTPTTN
jgi:hypothetical protein